MNNRLMHKLFFVSLFLIFGIHLIKAQMDLPGDLENEYVQLLSLKNRQINHLGYEPTIDPFVDSLEWSLWDQFSSKMDVKEGLFLLDLGFRTHINSAYPRGYNDGPVAGPRPHSRGQRRMRLKKEGFH